MAPSWLNTSAKKMTSAQTLGRRPVVTVKMMRRLTTESAREWDLLRARKKVIAPAMNQSAMTETAEYPVR
jgi:hypothetical protein